MKRAKVYFESFVIVCGGCGESICEPDTGTLYWTVWDLECNRFLIDCQECGKRNRVQIPQKMSRWMGEAA